MYSPTLAPSPTSMSMRQHQLDVPSPLTQEPPPNMSRSYPGNSLRQIRQRAKSAVYHVSPLTIARQKSPEMLHHHQAQVSPSPHSPGVALTNAVQRIKRFSVRSRQPSYSTRSSVPDGAAILSSSCAGGGLQHSPGAFSFSFGFADHRLPASSAEYKLEETLASIKSELARMNRVDQFLIKQLNKLHTGINYLSHLQGLQCVSALDTRALPIIEAWEPAGPIGSTMTTDDKDKVTAETPKLPGDMNSGTRLSLDQAHFFPAVPESLSPAVDIASRNQLAISDGENSTDEAGMSAGPMILRDSPSPVETETCTCYLALGPNTSTNSTSGSEGSGERAGNSSVGSYGAVEPEEGNKGKGEGERDEGTKEVAPDTMDDVFF